MAWDVVVQSEMGLSGTPLGDRQKRADPNRHSSLLMGEPMVWASDMVLL